MEKQYDHDYLFKVNNDSEGWERINQIRKDSKACKSNYKLVLRGSKPTTPWGSRPSIPLSEAQTIRVYVRPKETDQQRMDRATSQREGWLLGENLKLREKLRDMEANQSTFNEILRLREKAERLSRELGID